MDAYQRLVQIVQSVFADALVLFRDDPAWRGKTSAYFVSGDAVSGEFFPECPPVPLGTEVCQATVVKRIFVVQEKLVRLARHPEDLSSRMSRNPKALPWGEWGGAIRIHRGIVNLGMSFTGLPELGDEAVVIATAEEFFRASTGPVFHGMTLNQYLGEIATYPDPQPNEYAERLLAYRREGVILR